MDLDRQLSDDEIAAAISSLSHQTTADLWDFFGLKKADINDDEIETAISSLLLQTIEGTAARSTDTSLDITLDTPSQKKAFYIIFCTQDFCPKGIENLIENHPCVVNCEKDSEAWASQGFKDQGNISHRVLRLS